VIDRSKTRDTPCFPLAAKGRLGVWNSHRGNHLGQRSCASAKTGRTYGRKRSDQIYATTVLQGGGRPHMGSRRRSASQAIDLPSGGGVNLGRLFTLGAPPKTITFAFLHNLDPTKTSSLIASGRPSTRKPRRQSASISPAMPLGRAAFCSLGGLRAQLQGACSAFTGRVN
jgi:hypothetical protein